MGDTSSAATRPGRFRIQVEELDYTPPPGTFLGGYGWGPRASDGRVLRRLRAHCVAIYDPHGRAVVLLRVDILSIPRAVYLELRNRLLAHGLITAPQDLLLSMSHTHSGPVVGRIPDPYVMLGLPAAQARAIDRFTETFVDLLVRLVRRARQTLATPVTLGFASGAAFTAFNRSDPAANFSSVPTVPFEVPVLLARHADTGEPHAVLFGHACHPVCQIGDGAVDSDFCGHAADLVRRRLGIPALFFQGAAGDLYPRHRFAGEPGISDTGALLADAVVATVRSNAFRPLTGPVSAAIEEVQLPFAVDTADPAAVAELAARYRQRVRELEPGEHVPGGARRHAERMLELIEARALPRSMPMTLQRWHLGGLSILALGHETVSGYHVAAKRRFGRPLWIMGYANDVSCTVAGDHLLWQGGYEAGWWPDDGYQRLAGIGTAAVAYSLPAPLLASPRDEPGAPQATQGIVMAAIGRLLDC